jgi:hypothetical protein
MFDTSEFLHILDKQLSFIGGSVGRIDGSKYDIITEEQKYIPDAIISHLLTLSLTDEQRHVLYGFILLGICGANPDILLNKLQRVIYRKIEKLFIEYPHDTPEKRYCTYENYINRKKIENNTPPVYFEDFDSLHDWVKKKLNYQFGQGLSSVENMYDKWIESKGCYANKDTDEYRQYLTVDAFKKFIEENPDIVDKPTIQNIIPHPATVPISETDTSSKEIAGRFRRKIDAEKLEGYLNVPFKKTDDTGFCLFTKLTEDLGLLSFSENQYAKIALIIYNSKKMSYLRPDTFSEWHKIFFECIGLRKTKNYKPSQLKKTTGEALMRTFSYLL